MTIAADPEGMTIYDIFRVRCKHDEARTYEGAGFTQSTCDDCGDISISPTDFVPWDR